MTKLEWPFKIWATHSAAVANTCPDPYEAGPDTTYVLETAYDDVVTERNSWRDIACRLLQEKS